MRHRNSDNHNNRVVINTITGGNMNELKIFKNKELGLSVRTLPNPDGSISISAEDTAIGFGWTQEKNGKIYVKWERLNSFCREMGFSPQVGKDDYIPESLFYRLGMKASNPVAEKFQNWLAMDVIPSIRKTGSYEMPKKKQNNERLASVNNAVKILTPMLQAAGCNSKIQLLTAKSLYEKAGVNLPITIEADQQYVDTVHIARQARLYFQSSGKPADKAVNEIIRRLDLSEDMYTETWESKGTWQGTVRKYVPEVIGMVKQWYANNGYPREIPYTQCDGQIKKYHVIVRDSDAN
jgi:prophage antirepressor-like protein